VRGKNRKKRGTKDKPARDAFRRRVAREQKARPDELGVRFFVAEAAVPEQEKK